MTHPPFDASAPAHGTPDEEGVDDAQVADQLDDDPDAVPNHTDPTR